MGEERRRLAWPLKTGYGENVVTACSCVCWWGRYRALSHRQLQNGAMDVKCVVFLMQLDSDI